MREDYYAGLEDRNFLTFDQAKSQKLNIDFDAKPPAQTPNKLGVTLIDQVSLEDVVPYMDWVCLFLMPLSLNSIFVILSRRSHLSEFVCDPLYRIHSSKRGSFVADTQTVDTRKFLMMKLLEKKRRSCLMMLKL